MEIYGKLHCNENEKVSWNDIKNSIFRKVVQLAIKQFSSECKVLPARLTGFVLQRLVQKCHKFQLLRNRIYSHCVKQNILP